MHVAPFPLLLARVYHGERVSLDLADADVKDVLRYLSEVAKLNFSLGPGVAGSVTVRQVDTPWDKIL